MAIQMYPTTTGAGANVTQAQWQAMLSQIIADGVNKSVGGALAVSASTGMDSSVATGSAFLDGLYFNSNATTALTHSVADPTNDRIDLIVAHADLINDTANAISILTGTPAGSPVAPTVTQSGTVWEIALAEVRVHAGNTAASQFTYTDARVYAAPPILSAGLPALAVQDMTVDHLYQAAGVAEVGRFGGQFIASNTTSGQGPIVNFKRTMLNTPSSVSVTGGVTDNLAAGYPILTDYDVNGFRSVWVANTTGGNLYYGTYNTGGNCLRAVRADGSFDIHCDGCDRLLKGRALRGDLLANDLLWQQGEEQHPRLLELKHICPECGAEEHFNTGLASADERLHIPGWERRMEQAYLIRQAQELLKLPRGA